jgi:hypothetical protein
VAVEQRVTAERLRRLRRNEVLARLGRDHAVAVDTLERIGERDRRNDAVPSLECFDDRAEGRCGRERPRRIVAHDRIRQVRGERGDGRRDRAVSRGTTGDDLVGTDGERARAFESVRGRDDDDAVDHVRRTCGSDRVDQERVRTDGHERLRLVTPEALAGTRRRDDRRRWSHGPSVVDPPRISGRSRRACGRSPS